MGGKGCGLHPPPPAPCSPCSRWRHRGTCRIPFLPLVERQNKLTHLDISQQWIGVVWTIQHTINSELNGLFTEQVVFNKITIFFLQLAENGFANAFSLSYLYLRWRPVATNDWHPHRIRSIYITPILNWTGIFKFYIKVEFFKKRKLGKPTIIKPIIIYIICNIYL